MFQLKKIQLEFGLPQEIVSVYIRELLQSKIFCGNHILEPKQLFRWIEFQSCISYASANKILRIIENHYIESQAYIQVVPRLF